MNLKSPWCHFQEYTDIGGYELELEEYKEHHPESDVKNGGSYKHVPLDKLMRYALSDADATYRLFKIFKDELKEQDLDKLQSDIVTPASYVFSKMERNGIRIDLDYADKLREKYRIKKTEILI